MLLSLPSLSILQQIVCCPLNFFRSLINFWLEKFLIRGLFLLDILLLPFVHMVVFNFWLIHLCTCVQNIDWFLGDLWLEQVDVFTLFLENCFFEVFVSFLFKFYLVFHELIEGSHFSLFHICGVERGVIRSVQILRQRSCFGKLCHHVSLFNFLKIVFILLIDVLYFSLHGPFVQSGTCWIEFLNSALKLNLLVCVLNC